MFVEQIYVWPTFSPLEHCRLKNSHNLETESYIFVFLLLLLECLGLRAWETASQVTLRELF